MSAVSLLLPVVFTNPDAFNTEPTSAAANSNLLHAACSKAEPTKFISWGFETLQNDATEAGISLPARLAVGAAIGCADGTIFLFQPGISDRPRKRLSLSIRSNDVSSKNAEYLSQLQIRHQSKLSLHAGPASPTASKTNLSIAPIQVTRSRVVSGLSKERVEAPRNYVDFEEEQEKLKEMLNDRGVKDKTVVDGFKHNFSKGINLDNPSRSSSPSKRSISGGGQRDEIRSLISRANSPTFSPSTSTTSPPTPVLASNSLVESAPPGLNLSLKAHVFPRAFGPGHAMVDMVVLKEGAYIVGIQESGTLSLISSQDGACVAAAHVDNPPTFVQKVNTKRSSANVSWTWKHIQSVQSGQTHVIFACAGQHPDTIGEDEGGEEKTRVCVFELRGIPEREFGEVRFEKAGDFAIEGAAAGVHCAYSEGTGSLAVYFISPSGTMMCQPLYIAPISRLPEPPPSPDMPLISAGALSVPNPFKALTARNRPPSDIVEAASRIELGTVESSAPLPLTGVIRGSEMQRFDEVLFGAVWSDEETVLFRYDSGDLHILDCLHHAGLRNVAWHNSSFYSAVYDDRAESYLIHEVDGNNDMVDPKHDRPRQTHSELASSVPISRAQLTCIATSTQVLSTRLSSKGYRRIEFHQLKDSPPSAKVKPRNLWSSCAAAVSPPQSSPAHITAILPLELACLVVGYSDGRIRRANFQELVESMSPVTSVTSDRIDARIIGLHLLEKEATKEQFIVAGGDDGSITLWDLRTLRLLARWILFTSPLTQVLHLREENVGRLRDCALCIAADGTIAIVSVDGPEFLYLIPAAAAPLRRVCLAEDNLLLHYADGRARLWDVKTCEFWRSMDVTKAEDLVEQGEWFDTPIGREEMKFTQSGLSALPGSPNVLDSASAVLVNVLTLVGSVSSSQYLWNRTNADAGPDVSQGIVETSSARNMTYVRSLLAVLLKSGLNPEIDLLVRDQLGVPSSSAAAGSVDDNTSLTFLSTPSAKAVWCISPDITAARLVCILALLRLFLNFEAYEVAATAAIAFYTTSLPDAVGSGYQAPMLSRLARWWWDSAVSDIRQTSRMLFEAEVARLPSEYLIAFVERWQHRLPYVLPDGEKQSAGAAAALFLSASVAVGKYNLLSASTLTDMSKSISMYLHDEASPHMVMAIDLCSRGFQVWQHYFDAMDALRTLISLATSSRKDYISFRNPGLQARLAVLQIASSNTPLFMTTLSLDILNPRSIEYSKSIMQLVAFLIRKKPLVLHPNLPRLIEAVVKSLDPSSSAGREAVFDAATEILGQVVRTFPTVDFHMGTQRLVVGTSEGAVIMYDLKTATRLYVLEGHRRRLAAISFSPDGRRLVTLSLEESVVLVWKVGSSLSSFFYPGAPPRQGHGGSEPFKTLSFNVGDEANMSVAATLECVGFEWTADRSVKLRIRDSTLTFST